MARSLTVKHEEHVGNAWLLNGFLIFAAAWMLVAALSGASFEDGGAQAVAAEPAGY